MLLDGEVRPVVRAADDVRDPELDVVDDGCELVRGGPVGAKQRRPADSEPDRAVRVALGGARGKCILHRLDVEVMTLALPDRPLLVPYPEPLDVAKNLLLPVRHRTGGIGVVDPEDENAVTLVGEPAVGDSGQRIPEMQRSRRARREADAHSHHASIGTCPGCAATRSSHARIAGYASSSKPPSCATCVYA